MNSEDDILLVTNPHEVIDVDAEAPSPPSPRRVVRYNYITFASPEEAIQSPQFHKGRSCINTMPDGSVFIPDEENPWDFVSEVRARAAAAARGAGAAFFTTFTCSLRPSHSQSEG